MFTNSRYSSSAPMTDAFSIDPVIAAIWPVDMRWTVDAVRAVKMTTPITEMMMSSVPLPRNGGFWRASQHP